VIPKSQNAEVHICLRKRHAPHTHVNESRDTHTVLLLQWYLYMIHNIHASYIITYFRTSHGRHIFLDGYCSTVQGLLDWLEVDLGFTELLFIQIDLCVLCVFVRTSHKRRTEYYYHSGNFKVMHTSDEAEVHTCLRMSHQLHTRV